MAKKEKKEEGKEKKGKEKQKKLLTTAQLDAAPMAITLDLEKQTLTGDKKEFSSGSVGWNINGKVVIAGLRCQVSGNVVIIGSKEVKK